MKYPNLIQLPEKWVKTFQKLHPHHTYIAAHGVSRALYYLYPAEATEICRLYLETMDKTLWPTLIGQHPIMDQVIGQAFKQEHI